MDAQAVIAAAHELREAAQVSLRAYQELRESSTTADKSAWLAPQKNVLTHDTVAQDTWTVWARLAG